MIYLRKGQVVADIPNMVVYEPTGFYSDGDSVICAPAATPEDPVCRYEARYIAYGGMVYSISDPDQLLEEIIKIDPNSLYGKNGKQVAVDKAVETIVAQDQNTQQTPNVASTTPNLLNSTASSTSSLLGGENIASTTTNVTPDIVSDVATTTPAITPDISTTTPSIDAGEISTTTPSTGGVDTTPIETPVSTSTPTVSSADPGQGFGTISDMTTTTPNITPDFVPDVASTTPVSVPTEPILESVVDAVTSTEVAQ